jgi:hypothetical protein
MSEIWALKVDKIKPCLELFWASRMEKNFRETLTQIQIRFKLEKREAYILLTF